MSVLHFAAGIDLNRDETQICWYSPEKEETYTAPMKIGNEPVSFRDILDALDELADFGKESDLPARMSPDPEEGEPGQRLRRLYEQAADVIRQSLATLGITDPGRQLQGLVITVPALSLPIVSLIREVSARLGLDGKKTFLQDYRESFYYHTFYQKKELRSRKAGLFYFCGKDASFFSLSQNTQTRPVTVTCRTGPSIHLGEDAASWDTLFSGLIRDSLKNDLYSGIFIMGDAYDQSLMPRSTALLCSGGRKVFAVDSLFARGACYAAREKTMEESLDGFFYLGEDLVRCNIGMEMIVQGSRTWYPVVSAGVSWYDAGTSFSCLLEEGNELVFLISSLDGASRREEKLELTDLPERPPKTTRLEVSLTFSSPDRCTAEVRDAGFGDLFPSGGKIWRKEWEDL